MFQRQIKTTLSNSFFLFGQRGTGKSTYLRQLFKAEDYHYIDLLEDKYESRYLKSPDLLFSDVSAISSKKWIIIDEIQKNPKLLDLVQKLISEKDYKFILTGSSARKLKRAGSNLLAGRAFWYQMFPITHLEQSTSFDLNLNLAWGSLPKIFSYKNEQDKIDYLTSYAKTYLKEEILEEQIIRNVDGFRSFLEIAALMNGKNLNFLKIAREANIESKTAKEYFQILEDTLVGFWLPAFHESVRKAQKFQPKFLFFDLGLVRAISHQLDSKPTPGTSIYGQLFESFVITEIFKLNSYSRKDYSLSHYQTTGNQEIDLILAKGKEKILVEIKSYSKIDPVEVSAFSRICEPFKTKEKYFVSQDPILSKIDGVTCIHYLDFMKKMF